MKLRSGFVSNSSSSSFVCNKYSTDYNHFKASAMIVVKEKLLKIFDCMKGLEIITQNTKFEDVFQEPRKATKADIKELNEGWSANLKYNNEMYLINSTGDNTIPHEFFELIEYLFDADRIHLG